ncbi:outer membrane beta-barrel protein [Flavobacterium laiguense]|uniref:Outer membrane protein beta-barrel domain-containing protein n=1 Tax=Flavobacterium laiguense TaxID=2169409 RepID=A0A2U1JVU2_9FLAO|nr:outer membrane beta-barrel protein [Flavobacterium laiguense]PWA09105.1 hypothetical protein DB891_09175 [Flavobacterium laiguense]
MKRNLIIAFFVLTGILQSNAQVTFKPGINAGLNVSKIQNTNLDSKLGFYFGAFGALKLSSFYTLQPEISYSVQGGKGTVVGTDVFYDNQTGYETYMYKEGEAELALSYISSATINKFNLNKSLYVLVGPFVDILVGSSSSVDLDNNYNIYISKGEDIDFGIIGGVGFNFNKGLALESRIKIGTRDAYDDHQDNIDVNSNLVFQFGGTYTFDFK